MTRQPTRKKAAQPTAKFVEADLKIIQTTKCPTVTNKGTLIYNLGKDDKDNLHLRIKSNSNGGFFSDEWILLDSIIVMEQQFVANVWRVNYVT